jgi:hypothetical protein
LFYVNVASLGDICYTYSDCPFQCRNTRNHDTLPAVGTSNEARDPIGGYSYPPHIKLFAASFCYLSLSVLVAATLEYRDDVSVPCLGLGTDISLLGGDLTRVSVGGGSRNLGPFSAKTSCTEDFSGSRCGQTPCLKTIFD